MADKPNIYPWSHLAPQIVGTDLPIDSDTLVDERNTTRKTIEEQTSVIETQKATIIDLATEIEHKQKLIESQEKKIKDLHEAIEAAKRKYVDLQAISKKTFDSLQDQIETSSFDELLYPILVQAIISQKAGLIGEARHTRTLHGVIRWLQQRGNVILFLRNRNLFPDIANKLENVCFIEEQKLMKLIERLRF